MLAIRDLEVMYGGAVLALQGLSLEVCEGSIVALLGANGAGKSTTLKAVSGLLAGELGRVTGGSVRFLDEEIAGRTPEELVRQGIFHVMEGRRVFVNLTVEENLLAGGTTRRDRAGLRTDLDFVYDCFPRLRERKGQSAGYLSGGEQQMLAIGRGLLAAPRLLLLDEPSLGLAPILVREIFSLLQLINRERKTTMLLVEQNAAVALSIADRAFVVEGGRTALAGSSAELKASDEVRRFYLGMAEEGQRPDYRRLKEELRHAYSAQV